MTDILAADADADDFDKDIGESTHSENLAESMEPGDLQNIASELIGDYEDDVTSTEDMRKSIADGLDLLGVKLEVLDDPFPGACSASHPMMLEAAIQFQSRAIQELFPAGGPVRTRIMGDQTHERVEQAQRVREYMNYQLTEEMEEYEEDLDNMLFKLPLTGSCFRKVYYDNALGRPVIRTIPVGDFITAYTNSDLRTAARYTHIMRISPNERRKLEVTGFYREIDYSEPGQEEQSVVEERIDAIEGRTPSLTTDDSRCTLLEMHVDYDLEGHEDADEDDEPTGIALPYIITIDYDTRDIISIRRNWAENDPLRRRIQWFVHYRWLPSLGFYGFGLVHLLGNLQKSATAALRALIDAGQFATLPAGFKMRGARVSGGVDPIRFGEFRDIDAGGDDIRKSIMPLPVKEPSQTLFQLLGLLVDDGRRLASITDMNVGDSNKENPVGTTLALLEQGLRVMTAIHKRCHNAQGDELRILKRINHENMPGIYPYNVEGNTRQIKKADFTNNVDVLPVSDPNIFSETQRIMRAQAQLQIAQQFPQQHILHEALYRVHEVLGTPKISEILVPEFGPKPMDPATEEFAILHAKPVMAYAWQNHQAHLASHNAWMQNPQLGGNQQIQQMYGPAMLAHIADHTAHNYRQQIAQQLGIKLPPPPHYDPLDPGKDDGWQPMSPQIENMIAQRSSGVAQQLAQQAQQLQQAQQNQQMNQNPQVQAMLMEAQAKKQDADTRLLDVKLSHQRDSQEQAQQLQFEGAKQQQHLQGEQARLAMRMSHDREKHQLEAERSRLETRMKMISSALDLQQKRADGGQDLAIDRARGQQELLAHEAESRQDMALTRAEGVQDLAIQRAEFEQKQDHAEKLAEIQRKNAAAKPNPTKDK